MIQRLAVLILLATGIPHYANSQELRIGHLETLDDRRGLNWLFFHCNQSGETLTCDVFQSLISHKIPPDKKSENIARMMGSDPVPEFINSFGDSCYAMPQALSMASSAAASGRGADGRPVDPKQAEAAVVVMKAINDACKNTTPASVRHMVETMVDNDIKTCTVFNDFSQEIFHRDQATNAWISQVGPSGPCGSVQIGTLRRDEAIPSFWKYTEKKSYMNPSGVLANGLSCAKLQDYTLHYTWHAAENWTDCTWLENLMN